MIHLKILEEKMAKLEEESDLQDDGQSNSSKNKEIRSHFITTFQIKLTEKLNLTKLERKKLLISHHGKYIIGNKHYTRNFAGVICSISKI